MHGIISHSKLLCKANIVSAFSPNLTEHTVAEITLLRSGGKQMQKARIPRNARVGIN